mmetsp:Transcript_26764/g.85994  ORF Transcript_26764/g.85994 Transcript_26764/m.85994 type:complete len:212 (-) Transcript_26764:779-1414(-)
MSSCAGLVRQAAGGGPGIAGSAGSGGGGEGSGWRRSMCSPSASVLDSALPSACSGVHECSWKPADTCCATGLKQSERAAASSSSRAGSRRIGPRVQCSSSGSVGSASAAAARPSSVEKRSPTSSSSSSPEQRPRYSPTVMASGRGTSSADGGASSLSRRTAWISQPSSATSPESVRRAHTRRSSAAARNASAASRRADTFLGCRPRVPAKW